MNNKDSRGRSKWIEFRRGARNEREYEIKRHLKKEGKEELLEQNVDMTQRQIIEAAYLINHSDEDERQFLQILKQHAEEFDLDPDDVYSEELHPNSKWGYDFDIDEIKKLYDIVCSAYTYVLNNQEEFDFDQQESSIRLLKDLCDILETAVDTEIAPVLYQG